MMRSLSCILDKKSFYLCTIIVLSVLTTLPWLPLGNFYTRGEPREALVAMAMLEQHNFILPEFQGEIAFKPPFLHWLVALFSILQGHVSEFTSRLPSALAACFMFISFFSFMSKRMNSKHVFLGTLLLMSCFEIHRASMTCRVDMLLTSMIVLSLLCIYKWSENDYKGLPVLIPLFISSAILTKGPIGVILPCFILFVYMLLQREKVSKIIVSLLKITLSSSILPLCWYLAAYQQGGDPFLNLFMEENFGRFLGKMSYESHENGIMYNVYSLLAGLLPWTLLVFFSLFTFRYKKTTVGVNKAWFVKQWNEFLAMDKVRLFSLVVAVCVFVFYCIPKSKRSVYTMPMYPFICLFLAEYFYYLYHTRIKTWKAFNITLSFLSVVLIILMIAIHWINLDILGTSHSSQRIISQMSELQDTPFSFFYIFFIVVLLIIVFCSVKAMYHHKCFLYYTVFVWFGINLVLDGLVIPSIKNSVPDYYLAKEINERYSNEKIYSYRPLGKAVETFYVVCYYLADKCQNLSEEDVLPDKGYILLREDTLDDFEKMMKDYDIEEISRSLTRFTTAHGYILFYQFSKKQEV